MTRSAQRRHVDDLADQALSVRRGDPPPAGAGLNVASLRHQWAMEAKVQQGQPPFPHALLWAITIVTAGVFAPVHYLLWLGSAQRRYRRAGYRALRAQNLL